MILKCVGGPLDGAVYVLSQETIDPAKRSTTRKPDGLWFDGTDEHGRNVQYQYVADRVNAGNSPGHVQLVYEYSGQVVDTGVEFETDAGETTGGGGG